MKYCIIQTIKNKRNSEWVTSSTLSFAYHWVENRTVLWKISETLKYHNFLILDPILMKFSVSCLFDFSHSIQIRFLLGWTCPLKNIHVLHPRTKIMCTALSAPSKKNILPSTCPPPPPTNWACNLFKPFQCVEQGLWCLWVKFIFSCYY